MLPFCYLADTVTYDPDTSSEQFSPRTTPRPLLAPPSSLSITPPPRPSRFAYVHFYAYPDTFPINTRKQRKHSLPSPTTPPRSHRRYSHLNRTPQNHHLPSEFTTYPAPTRYPLRVHPTREFTPSPEFISTQKTIHTWEMDLPAPHTPPHFGT